MDIEINGYWLIYVLYRCVIFLQKIYCWSHRFTGKRTKLYVFVDPHYERFIQQYFIISAPQRCGRYRHYTRLITQPYLFSFAIHRVLSLRVLSLAESGEKSIRRQYSRRRQHNLADRPGKLVYYAKRAVDCGLGRHICLRSRSCFSKCIYRLYQNLYT